MNCELHNIKMADPVPLPDNIDALIEENLLEQPTDRERYMNAFLEARRVRFNNSYVQIEQNLIAQIPENINHVAKALYWRDLLVNTEKTEIQYKIKLAVAATHFFYHFMLSNGLDGHDEVLTAYRLLFEPQGDVRDIFVTLNDHIDLFKKDKKSESHHTFLDDGMSSDDARAFDQIIRNMRGEYGN